MSEQKIVIADADLRKGAEAGMDEFLKVFTDAYIAATGGVINAETMPLLNGMQHREMLTKEQVTTSLV